MKEPGRKEHCAQLLLLLLHTSVYLVLFRPMSIKWEWREEEVGGGHMHTTQQLHRCLAFWMKKEGDEEEEKQEMGLGGE